MSNCEEALTDLYSYVDGELTDERRAVIAAHLDSCPPCLDEHDLELELRRVVATRCQDRVPTDLRDRIGAALEAVRDAEPGSVN